MKAIVTEQGLLIPKQMLEGINEVEIRRENGVIVLVPVSQEDPIFGVGQAPVPAGTTDASVNHDRYLYGSQ